MNSKKLYGWELPNNDGWVITLSKKRKVLEDFGAILKLRVYGEFTDAKIKTNWRKPSIGDVVAIDRSDLNFKISRIELMPLT